MAEQLARAAEWSPPPSGWQQPSPCRPGGPARTSLQAFILKRALGPGRLLVLAGLVFIVPLADLLLNLLADHVNGRVKVAIHGLCKQIRSRHHQPHRAGKLTLRRFGLVVIENHSRLNGKAIQVLQLRNPTHDVVLNGLGQRQIMRRKDQVHALEHAARLK